MNENTVKMYSYKTENGNIVYYTNEIDLQKETILMLHPAFGDYRIFTKQIDAFYNDYNLVLIDLPGHGNSVHKGSSLNMGLVPILIHGIIEHLDIKEVHLIGISLSSLLVQAFADQYPEMTKTVTTVGGYSIHSDNRDVLKAQRKEMMKWTMLIIISMKRFRKYIVNATSISTEGRNMMSQAIKPFRRRNFRYMQGIDKIFHKKLSFKEYPILSVVGERDQKISIESAKKLGNTTNGKYYMIPNSGHCANIDTPNEFNIVFHSFIQNH